MAHPIFDRASYPWSRREARTFHELLSKAITNAGEIELLYQGSAEDGVELPGLTKPQAPRYLWQEALQNLALAGVLRNLVDQIQAKYEKNEAILLSIRNLRNAQPATRMRIFTKDNSAQPELLVLDRGTLTEHLERLESDAGTMRAILVRGAPGTGKSHGRHRFFQTARENGAKPVYIYSPWVTTVRDVIDELFSALDASTEVPDNFTTDPAYYKQACRKLKEIASKQGTRMWIAIDDLGADNDGVPLLDTEIRRFCDLLVLSTVNPEFGEWFRLMLIDYPPGPVPTWWFDDNWGEDDLNYDDVQEEHIAEVLEWWLDKHDLKMIESKRVELVNEVIATGNTLEGEPENSTERLRRIHDALAAMLSSLVEQ